MIRINPVEPADDPGWVKWRESCRKAHDRLREVFASWHENLDPPVRKPAPDRTLYAAQQNWIAEKFFLKCAYCEVRLDPGNRRGQVDHYRPKGSVRNRAGEVVTLQWGCVADSRPHPGYYWLAYEWTNLLPVCAACNNRTNSFQGRKGGKSEWFPVAGDAYTAEPGKECECEKPLLLNPWIDDPAEHMRFCPANGMIAPVTERGAATVELFDLNRDGLVDERRTACEIALGTYREYSEHLIKARIAASAAVRQASREEAMRLNGVFEQWRTGNGAFSAFLVAAIDYAETEVRSAFGQGGRPAGPAGTRKAA